MQKRSSFSSTVWWLIIGTLFSRLGTSMTSPFMSFFLHEKIGLSLSAAGLIIGVSYLAFALGGFWGGAISDRIGRRPLLLISLIAYSMVFILFGFFSNVITQAFYVAIIFFLLNIISGLSQAWYETLVQASLADAVAPKQKLKVFSYRYVGINIGSAIGPVIGVALGFSGSSAGFYFTGIILLVYFISFYWNARTTPETNSKLMKNSVSLRKALNVLSADKAFRNFVIGNTVFWIGYAQQTTMLAQIIFTCFHSIKFLSVLYVINALMIIFLQIPLTNKLLRGYSYLPLIITGVILSAIGLAGFGIAGTHVSLYIISEVLLTLGEILGFSYAGVVIDSLAPEHLRGAYFGASTLQYLGRGLGPLASGILLQHTSIIFSMLIIAAITLFSAMFFWRGMRQPNSSC